MIVAHSDLAQIREANPNSTIVLCHGVFDLLHHGHLMHLRSARQHGDVLVVSVTVDEFVNKGPGRPHFPTSARLDMIDALNIVDYCVASNSPTSVEVITELRPDIVAKGPDYSSQQDDTGQLALEQVAAESVGGAFIFTGDDTHSSTTLINNYIKSWSDRQREVTDQLRARYSFNDFEQLLEVISGMRILVIGETIVDTYKTCRVVGASSKGSALSTEYCETRDDPGGALAVARHAAALGCTSTTLVPTRQSAWEKAVLEQASETDGLTVLCEESPTPMPRKTRFVAEGQMQTLLTVNESSDEIWEDFDWSKYSEATLKLSMDSDLALTLDFGHGLWNPETRRSLANLRCPWTLNSQTNSQNLGYNNILRHSNYCFASLDLREARLAVGQRFATPEFLAEHLLQTSLGVPFALTTGPEGCIFVAGEGNMSSECPSFFTDAIDTTGAGDAFFTMSSLVVQHSDDPLLCGFMGNVFAGLAAQVRGNARPVGRVEFMRAVRSIMQF